MNDRLTILCTGGIGSGKSCVAKAFQTLGVPSFDCDSVAKNLYDTDAGLLARVAAIAGNDVLENGKLSRKALAGKIFSDSSMLLRIEDAVHPAVVREFGKWKKEQKSDIVLIESAIMLYKPMLAQLPDYVVEVAAPREVRIARVMERDGCTRDQVELRMDSQEKPILRAADYTIITDDRHDVLPELIELLDSLKNGKDRS